MYPHIMRRTQLCPDEDLFEKRKQAMQAFVGIWKDRPEFRRSEAYVRRLRRGTRMQRLEKL